MPLYDSYIDPLEPGEGTVPDDWFDANQPEPTTPDPTTPAPTESAFFPGGVFNGDYEGYFRSLFPGQTTLTGAQLKAREADLKRAGINVVTSASGNTGWVNWPGSGGDWDVIGDYGGANTLQWIPPGSGGQQQFDPNTIGSLLEPWGGTPPADLELPEFEFHDFVLPTGEEVLADDPGYGFRVSQGEQALMANRAMQGTLNGGGTAKDLFNYNQQAASQEYANAFDRRLNTYKTNFGTRRDTNALNSDRLRDMYNARYKNYLDQYNIFRQRQQDSNAYLTEQQRIGIAANQ